MAEPVIKIEDVGKRYRLGQGFGPDAGLTHHIDRALRAPFRLLRGETATEEEGEEFWAVRGVSLEIERGEMFGMVGANGAGKSTLLKMLAQITTPTEGRITIRGQVGSLLEVGTGFHPELSGRENVFLSGAIHGMRRREIAARYDEIVEFAGIQDFMETPVKRYSSGMFVRLGFAVASHLRPNILLVDEVLAVGDAPFQRKCLDKMQEITNDAGTTVIFVTHNMSWIRRICDRAVYLESGRAVLEGAAAGVVDDYLEKVEPVKHGGVAIIPPDARRSGTGGAKLTRAEISNSAGESTDRVGFGEAFTIKSTFDIEEAIPEAMVSVGISTLEASRVASNYSTEGGRPLLSLRPGVLEISATIDATLLPGEYVVEIAIGDARGAQIDLIERVLTFTAMNIPAGEDGERYPFDAARGAVRPDSEWAIEGSSTALADSAEARATIS